MDPVAWLFVEDVDFHPTLTPDSLTIPPKPKSLPRVTPTPSTRPTSQKHPKNTEDEERKNTFSENLLLRNWLVTNALKHPYDSLARRHLELKSAASLSLYMQEAEMRLCEDREMYPHIRLENAEIEGNMRKELSCYGCNKVTTVVHRNYIYSCPSCGDRFERYRFMSRPLPDHWAVVTGGRTKLGYQVVLKLLRAGAHVIPTTRQPERALEQYTAEPDAWKWMERLHLYPEKLDLLAANLPEEIEKLHNYVRSLTDRVDVLVNSAAQTIRAFNEVREVIPGQTNKYGDPAKLLNSESSWNLRLHDISYTEWQEVFLVNAIAPALLISKFTSLLRAEDCAALEMPQFAYIINVHAREGLFNVKRKGNKHVHTNMAKAALAQLTRCLADSKSLTEKGRGQRPIRVHGVDPGWISTDEYSESACPWVIPPLDDIDGAARILHPLWEDLYSEPKTRRHFSILKY